MSPVQTPHPHLVSRHRELSAHLARWLVVLLLLLIYLHSHGWAQLRPNDQPQHVICDSGCAGGPGGGGLAELQVRDAGDTTWVNVGTSGPNLHVPVDLLNSLPAGANVIGGVTQSGTWNVGTLTSITNSVAVTGTFWQVTQPVSSTQLPAALDGSGFLKTHEQGTHAVTQSGAPWSFQLRNPANSAFMGDSSNPIYVNINSNLIPGVWLNDGNGQPITSNSSTGSFTTGIDVNIRSILGSTPGTAGKLDVKAADGDVFVRQTTGTNLHMVCDSGCTPGGSTGDNTAFSFGTTALSPMGAVVDDVATNSVTENSVGTPRMSATRILYMDLSKTAANTNKLLVTPDSVALPANQSVNISQINAITPLMGNGTTGTGSLRVTIASDNTAFTVNAAESGTWTVQPGNTANSTPWLTTDSADVAPAAALPAKVDVVAGRDSTQTGGGAAIPVYCDKSAAITATAAATVVVIPLAASKITYICGFVVTGAGAAGTMQWKSGTGTTCGTGGVNLTGAMATAIGGTVPYGNGVGTIMRHASAAQDTCITMATASATAAGVVSFAQF